MDETVQQVPDAQVAPTAERWAPPGYTWIPGERNPRILVLARADGLPMGTPPPERPRPPDAPTYEARKTAFLRGCLERGGTTIRGGRATPAVRQAVDPNTPSGEAIRARREALGLSQRDLAALAGRARGLLAEIEKGTRNAPETRVLLGNALTLRERNRPAAPAERDGLPRAEAG